MGDATVVVPKEQTALCSPFPKFEERDYSDTELRDALNTWISINEKCAAKQRVLSAFVLQMYGKKPAK